MAYYCGKIYLHRAVSTCPRHDTCLHTFISALESSPVHCLKPRPSGNWRNPGNKGTAAILFQGKNVYIKDHQHHAPLVDVRKNLLCPLFAMNILKIVSYPLHKMVFECPFDDLMQKVQ